MKDTLFHFDLLSIVEALAQLAKEENGCVGLRQIQLPGKYGLFQTRPPVQALEKPDLSNLS